MGTESCFTGAGKKTEANYHYTRALELDPGHVESNFRYARLLEEKGEPFEAEAHYIEALKADPESPNFTFFTLVCLQNMELYMGQGCTSGMRLKLILKMLKLTANMQDCLPDSDTGTRLRSSIKKST
ncbi:tetratricopeptide repeat protein [Methanosarcina horonobensis]|uniref:tetratricopeptide repeat protein n=1 Tax=Methanosarcina horonobensis TaxID=418008 RepID=UPI000AB06B50|nr:tetratricopeptide repeat protein [Methanosarcina horonobensis]